MCRSKGSHNDDPNQRHNDISKRGRAKINAQIANLQVLLPGMLASTCSSSHCRPLFVSLLSRFIIRRAHLSVSQSLGSKNVFTVYMSLLV